MRARPRIHSQRQTRDTYVSFLELKHHWFYLLQGRDREMARNVITYADVLTEHPGEGEEKSRLYRGVVYDFEVSKDGKIATLTLTEVRRGRGRGTNFNWKAIPGNHVTIMEGKIHSINVTYLQVDLKPQGRAQQARYYARTLWRSFVFQEP